MSESTKTLVNTIRIPLEYADLCESWHGGRSCLLYAILSTGGLTLGSIRPPGCNTDEKWYLTLWRELSCDIFRAGRAAGTNHEDKELLFELELLSEFEAWARSIVDRLESEYGLADWEA